MSISLSDNILYKSPKPPQEYERKLLTPPATYTDWASTAEIDAFFATPPLTPTWKNNKYFWVAGSLMYYTGSAWIGVAGGGTVTGAESGVHLDGTVVRLGGELLEATDINTNGFDFTINSAESPLSSVLKMIGGSTQLGVTDSLGAFSFISFAPGELDYNDGVNTLMILSQAGTNVVTNAFNLNPAFPNNSPVLQADSTQFTFGVIDGSGGNFNQLSLTNEMGVVVNNVNVLELNQDFLKLFDSGSINYLNISNTVFLATALANNSHTSVVHADASGNLSNIEITGFLTDANSGLTNNAGVAQLGGVLLQPAVIDLDNQWYFSILQDTSGTTPIQSYIGATSFLLASQPLPAMPNDAYQNSFTLVNSGFQFNTDGTGSPSSIPWMYYTGGFGINGSIFTVYDTSTPGSVMLDLQNNNIRIPYLAKSDDQQFVTTDNLGNFYLADVTPVPANSVQALDPYTVTDDANIINFPDLVGKSLVMLMFNNVSYNIGNGVTLDVDGNLDATSIGGFFTGNVLTIFYK